jgi:4-amino-4-deoxy-L-arabinose transferase-like glycosyltransferase
MFDMLLTALLTAALMYAFRFLTDNNVRFVRFAYGYLALAVLAKGFVALVLFGLVLAGFVFLTQRSVAALLHSCKMWLEPVGILIFFAIAAPWHLAASLVEPVFPWFYFINEHVLRFLGKREPHDYYGGAWWYYLPRVAIYLFPWSFLLPCLIGRAARPMDHYPENLNKFLWLAWLAPLIFFSASSAKANYYLLAVMPFAVFHLALAIENRGFLKAPARAAPGALIGILSLGLCIALAVRVDPAVQTVSLFGLTQRQFSVWFSAGMALLAFVAAWVAWRRAQIGLIAYLALPFYIALALTLTLVEIEPMISTRRLAQYVKSDLAGRNVYLYRNFEELSSLPFYLKRPVQVIESTSNDLYWGNRLHVNEIVLSAKKFETDAQQASVAVVVPDRQLPGFKTEPFYVRFKGMRRIGAASVFIN